MTRPTEPKDDWARPTADGDASFADRVRRFRVIVVDGPGLGLTYESTSDRVSIGAHPANDLVLPDPLASRFHCEVSVLREGPLVRDLGSRNGTFINGVRVREAFVLDGNHLRVGRTTLELRAQDEHNQLPLSDRRRFGAMSGRSASTRAVFALLEKAAASNATVLLEGETGTGKGAAAESIHAESTRRDAPFGVVDCGAIPPNLLEAELFGHEKGAFTGAGARRVGAFEAAHRGTVFLDEIGELTLDLQPKLLRVLEGRTVRRVGSNEHLPLDVRVIAATNRDLRAEVNAGRFRADLYYRLAVIKICMPPLRQRPDDLGDLCRHVLASLGASPEQTARVLEPEHIARLARSAWPGNVRELRNYLERCLVFEAAPPPGDALDLPPQPAASSVDVHLTFADARSNALARFERAYVEGLLREHDGKVLRAARAADVNRVYLYRLMRRHGLKGGPSDGT